MEREKERCVENEEGLNCAIERRAFAASRFD
jgi:hypothetical protein